jgi:hypothetical protein
MTDIVTGTDPSSPDPAGVAPSPRRARPVRWLAVTLVASVLLLLGAALTGAVAPQVRPEALPPGPAWAGGGQVEIEVTNEAVTSTRLVGAGEAVPGLDLVGVDVAAPDGSRSQLGPDGLVIPGHGRATVVLAYTVTDCGLAALASSDPIPVRFRTPLGLTRTLEIADGGMWANPMFVTSCPAGAGGPVA